jgi:hypothetical protein
MTVFLSMLALVVGGVLGGGATYLVLHLLHVSAPLPPALVVGGFTALYGTSAFGFEVYKLGFFSLLGFVLDVTWSIVTTVFGLIWLVICLITGSPFVTPDDLSKRSGTFVYQDSPRGGGYVMTVGNVIAGGWSSHEETHVWQARIFGPPYLVIYIVNLVVNLIFRWVSFDFTNYADEAYRRVCFEDWAYLAGTHPGSEIHWGFWFVGFILASLYTALLVLIVVGIVTHKLVLILVGTIGLLVYTIIRTFLPHAE